MYPREGLRGPVKGGRKSHPSTHFSTPENITGGQSVTHRLSKYNDRTIAVKEKKSAHKKEDKATSVISSCCR